MINQIYPFYLSHFILLKDFVPFLHLKKEEIEICFEENLTQEKWQQVCEIETVRKKILIDDIQKLNTFITLTQSWRDYMLLDIFKKESIEQELNRMIQNKFSIHELEKSATYVESFMRSLQFIIAYLEQEPRDIKELKQKFGVNCEKTMNHRLYHPLALHLLSQEVVEYININQRIYKLMNGTNQERNHKGQFVKKS